MSNYKQNGIDFTIKDNFTGTEKNHIVNGKLTSAKNDYSGYEEDDSSMLINAVDIDWNGAKPGIGEDTTNGITTTGELLSSIKGVYSPMFAN